jgi:hypothetical protein
MTERALEEHLELHRDETPFGKSGVSLGHSLPCRQVFTPVNAIDPLGFETGLRDDRGKTAREIAEEAGHAAVFSFLGGVRRE